MNEMIQRMEFWCQKVLPLVYDDSLSYYELLCKVVDYLNKVIDNTNDLNKVVLKNTEDIELLKKDITYLNDELEKVKNGEYVSLYLDSIIAWIDANLYDIVGRIAKFVFFEIDDEGYFNALIPESWDDIEFSTTDAGNLVLEY
jgi:hypothetical protein